MTDRDEDDLAQAASHAPSSYTCPGEMYSIPRSIHLARLAAFYPKCRDCEHRLETKMFMPRAEEHFQTVQRRATRPSLLTDECVRGVYLNELDRNRALSWGEAVAAYLWDEQPMVVRHDPDAAVQLALNDSTSKSASGKRGPTVIVGFDERPSSPDIATGVVLGLRRMGCSVIDLGQTAAPVVAYHVQSLVAAAGLFVTGAGRDPSWTGFDLTASCGRPFPATGLAKLEDYVNQGVSRQTRQIGRHQPLQGLSEYESSLESHFHALRPLRIVCGTATRLMPRVMERAFSRLPCELTHIALPVRRRNLFDIRDADLQKVGRAVVDGQRHLGLVIDEDGRHLVFVTDRGRLVSPREIARLLIEYAQRDHRNARFAVATSWLADVRNWLAGRDATAVDGGESAEQLVGTLVERQAILGLSADGRIWFGHDQPVCDAIVTLAKVLQALSLSDQPMSEVISRIGQDIEDQSRI